MRAVVVQEPGKVEIITTNKPSPGPYQALVRTDAAYFCNMTDSKLVHGSFPGVDTYPLALGHESTGLIEAVGDKVKNFHIGQRAISGLVFDFQDPELHSGWGGFSEFTLVNDHEAMLADGVADEDHGWYECYEIQNVVDDDISAKEAALLCTWREVYGGIGDFHITPEDSVLIFGGGPVGLSFVKFLKLMGLPYVALVDPNPPKHALAKSMGADATFTPDSEDLKNLTALRGKPLDVVLDAVGHENIINSALPLIKMGGTIGVYGVIAAEKLTLEKNKAPYNFNLLIHQWPTRHRERTAQQPLCQWVREGKLNADEFISHEFAFENIMDAYQAVADRKVIKALIHY